MDRETAILKAQLRPVVVERTSKRFKLLKELYDYYFKNGGATMVFEIEANDTETDLAYDYLAEKGFIYLEREDRSEYGKKCKAKITVHGIDYIESGI